MRNVNSNYKMSERHNLALDNDRELAAEVGLLLSCYAIIDLFILHIFSIVSNQPKDSASIVLSKIKGNGQRLELIKEIISSSNRQNKNFELELVGKTIQATKLRNQYAHAIYSGVSASPTGWRMSMWLSDGGKRKKEFKDISVEIVRRDGDLLRSVLNDLFYFGSIEVAYE
jgi:hypothetical protein